jgi:hypothetical protein
MNPATFDAAEFAARLADGHSAGWVLAQANAGLIPSRKIGRSRRFTEQDLADYLDSVREGGDTPRLSRLTRGKRAS